MLEPNPRGTPRELSARRFQTPSGEYAVLAFAPNGVHLTRAEVVILAGILRGATDAEIAAERGTAARTVSNQVAALFAKLGVGSRAELTASWLDILSAAPRAR